VDLFEGELSNRTEGVDAVEWNNILVIGRVILINYKVWVSPCQIARMDWYGELCASPLKPYIPMLYRGHFMRFQMSLMSCS
jgi:hypothetical protein